MELKNEDESSVGEDEENSNDEEQEITDSSKKQRVFCAKTFRQELSTKKGSEALKQFVLLCTKAKKKSGAQDYALEYLEQGGSCSEILDLLRPESERRNFIAPNVFEGFNIVLLKILSSYPDKYADAEDACRVLLVKYLAAIKQIFSRRVNVGKKKVIMKLLSTLVTMSPELAKEVLIHVSFSSEELEFLTRHSASKKGGSTVRTTFIHFLVSFLIEGNASTIVSLLEKQGLFTCIFGGLLYDKSDTVILTLTATKNNILKNKYISKTLKMNTFNTYIVQHIVNLYNWKGPENFQIKNKSVNVDPVEKEKVSIAVHDFLLVLCASHRHGVIFHDPLIGLGTKKLNPLMFTVLKGMDKPWDHPRASELIISICVACPDLVQYNFKYIEPFLEPRASPKWTNAVRFLNTLLNKLGPDSIEQFLNRMSSKQVVTIAELFSMPQCALPVIKLEAILHDDVTVRLESTELLLTVLQNVNLYIGKINTFNSFSADNKINMKSALLERLMKILPPATVILKAWDKSITDKTETSTDTQPDIHNYLHKLLDILKMYYELNIRLIENISKDINVQSFLQRIQDNFGDENGLEMQLKVIELFYLCDNLLFSPTTELFSYVLPYLIKAFYGAPVDVKIRVESILYKIFTLSTIFEGAEQEIVIWLYSVLEQNEYDDKIGEFLTESLKIASKNFLNYMQEISDMKKKSEVTIGFNFKEFVETLEIKVDDENNIYEKSVHVNLSPYILGVLDYISESDCSDIVGFINISLVHLLHSQTSPKILMYLILDSKYEDRLSKNILKYYNSWHSNTGKSSLKKIYNTSTIIPKLSKSLLSAVSNDSEELLSNSELTSHHVTLITKMSMFYFVQSALNDSLTIDMKRKYLSVINHLLHKTDEYNNYICLNTVLKHPVALQLFKPTYNSASEVEKLSTDFILDVIRILFEINPDFKSNDYLNSYRVKLVKGIHVMIKKVKKKNNVRVSAKLIEILHILELSHNNCNVVMEEIVGLPLTFYNSGNNSASVIVDLISYILSRLQQRYSEDVSISPLTNDIVEKVSAIYVSLNDNDEINLEMFETGLCDYINHFPHSIGSLDAKFFQSVILKSNITKSTLKLAVCLLKCNPSNIEAIVENLDAIVSKRELIFCLLSTANDELPSTQTVFEKTYKEHENMILKFLNKPQKVPTYFMEQYKLVAKLMNQIMDVAKCKEFASKHHKFDATEVYHAEILTTVYNRCIQSETVETERNKYISNYIITNMNLLLNIIKRAEKVEEDWVKIKSVATIFITYCNKLNYVHKFNYIDNNLCKNASFQMLSKFCLKYGIEGQSILLDVLRQLCNLTNGEQELGMIFEMAVSHSECLNVLLSETEVKTELLHLLLLLCKRCPSVKCKAHIPVWLSAYKASLSLHDQYLLQLLTLYEDSELEFYQYRPYVWGNAAVTQFSIHMSVDTALFRQPSPREVLDLLDENKITNTITHFPIKRKLTPDGHLYSDDDIEVYDPAFYLPLFGNLLAPESIAKWYHFKRRGAISLAIVALASEVKEVRMAACYVLSRFYGLLESTSMGKDRLLWVHLIEIICNGVSALEDLNMSTVVAVFMARCAMVFSQPGHGLYTALGQYIMAKECPDFTKVPEFQPLFHSSEMNHNVHQQFILEVLRDGLKSDNDYKVMSRTVVFKYIMDFFNCVLVSHETKKQILEILAVAVNVPLGARVLTSCHCLLPWLQVTFDQSSNDFSLLLLLIDILHNLVLMFSAEQLKENQFDLLLILTSIINNLQTIRLPKLTFVKFVRILYLTYKINCRLVDRAQVTNLIKACGRVFNNDICNYYLTYGIDYVQKPTLDSQDVLDQGLYYLKLFTIKWIENNVTPA